jgi:hypothetical protein
MCWHNSHKANYRGSIISFQRKSKKKPENVSKLITCITIKLNLSGESIKQLQIINRIGISVEYISITADGICR